MICTAALTFLIGWGLGPWRPPFIDSHGNFNLHKANIDSVDTIRANVYSWDDPEYLEILADTIWNNAGVLFRVATWHNAIGRDCSALGQYATVGGGYENAASGQVATVSGGYNNTASGVRATVGGGDGNTASSELATVAGGYINTASGQHAIVGGGEDNTASSSWCVTGGGIRNEASDTCAAVGGGYENRASGNFATIPGGQDNLVESRFGFAVGYLAQVWGDAADSASMVLGTGVVDSVPYACIINGDGDDTLSTAHHTLIGTDLTVDGNITGQIGSPGNCQILYVDTIYSCSPVVLNGDLKVTQNVEADTGKLYATDSWIKRKTGGTSAYRFLTRLTVHSGTPYIVLDNKPFPGDSMTIYLSYTGKGDAERFKVVMPDSIALTAGAARTTTENYVYYHINAGNPDILVSATELEHSGKGAMRDSLLLVGNYALGAASASAVQVRTYVDGKAILNKDFVWSTHREEWRTDYETGVDPTIRPKSIGHNSGLGMRSRHNYIPPADNQAGDQIFVVTFSDSNNAHFDSASGIYEYSDGGAFGPNDKYWLVYYGNVTDDTTKYQICANIQTSVETFSRVEDCEQAIYMMPTSLPDIHKQCGMLLYAVIMANNGDSTCFLADGSKYRNLRGASDGIAGGTGAPATDSTQIASWHFSTHTDTRDSAVMQDGSTPMTDDWEFGDKDLSGVEKLTLDTLHGTDATGVDSFWLFDDGDTTRFESDNPIKIGNGSLIVSGDTVRAPIFKGVGAERYVDRGDPAAWDYQVGDLTTDAAWHDLTLYADGHITAAQRGHPAYLIVKGFDNVVNVEIMFRENGNSNEINVRTWDQHVASQWTYKQFWVQTDANGVIEYKASNTTWDALNILVGAAKQDE